MMKKSLLTASVLGVIGAAVSSVALAQQQDTSSTYCKPGFYVGIQGGRTDTYYNPSDVLTQAASNGSGISTTYNATMDPTGSYIASGSVNTTTSYTTLYNQDTDSVGAGGRVFVGYQFNPYFATELGYTHFAKTTFSANGVTTATTNETDYSFNPNGSVASTSQGPTSVSQTATNYSGDINENAVDLVLKGTLPLQYGFGLYAKAGAAYVTADKEVNSNTSPSTTISGYGNAATGQVGGASLTNNNTNGISTTYSSFTNAIRPVYGVGVDYTVPNTSFDVDVSWTRIQGAGAIPNADLLALGVAYKFA